MQVHVAKPEGAFSRETAVSRPLLVHHVAAKLGLSRRMVRRLAETAQLPARKAGKKIWQFERGAVEEFRIRRELRNARQEQQL